METPPNSQARMDNPSPQREWTNSRRIEFLERMNTTREENPTSTSTLASTAGSPLSPSPSEEDTSPTSKRTKAPRSLPTTQLPSLIPFAPREQVPRRRPRSLSPRFNSGQARHGSASRIQKNTTRSTTTAPPYAPKQTGIRRKNTKARPTANQAATIKARKAKAAVALLAESHRETSAQKVNEAQALLDAKAREVILQKINIIYERRDFLRHSLLSFRRLQTEPITQYHAYLASQRDGPLRGAENLTHHLTYIKHQGRLTAVPFVHYHRLVVQEEITDLGGSLEALLRQVYNPAETAGRMRNWYRSVTY